MNALSHIVEAVAAGGENISRNNPACKPKSQLLRARISLHGTLDGCQNI